MQVVTVLGSFALENGRRIDGTVEFLPLEPWTETPEGVIANLGAIAQTSKGQFKVELTGTKGPENNYRALTPAGEFEIRVPACTHPVYLKDLIDRSMTA